jgi:hypothetical protein
MVADGWTADRFVAFFDAAVKSHAGGGDCGKCSGAKKECAGECKGDCADCDDCDGDCPCAKAKGAAAASTDGACAEKKCGGEKKECGKCPSSTPSTPATPETATP